MTQEQVDAHQARLSLGVQPSVPKKKSKYQNIRCQAADGTNFASRLERDYYEQLLLRWKAGDVRWFTRQVPFWLEGGVKINVDFMEVTDTGIKFVDTKGLLLQDFANKLKQLKARYGIDVELVRSV